MNESKYFFRKAVFIQKEKQVELVTDFEPTKTTSLDAWMSLIFLMADGMHTIDELHHQLTQQYRGNIPKDYKQTVESVIKRLLESDAIGLSEKSMQLPPYLTTSFDKQDQKKSIKLMIKEGFLKLEDLQ